VLPLLRSPSTQNSLTFSSTTHSSISLITLNFPHTKTISPKPFNPKPQLFNSLHCLPSISFNEFLLTQQIIEEEDEDDEEDEEVDEEQPRRLFVGNLPFSLSSSQLAELFREAGNAVSVEVSNFLPSFLAFQFFGCFLLFG
jgi:nucleolin